MTLNIFQRSLLVSVTNNETVSIGYISIVFGCFFKGRKRMSLLVTSAGRWMEKLRVYQFFVTGLAGLETSAKASLHQFMVLRVELYTWDCGFPYLLAW